MVYSFAVMIVVIMYGSASSVPTKVDHCASTGPVGSQGSCGSVWAFAASHTLTGRLKMRDGPDAPLIRLSEQQLVDCTYYRSGCDGGSISAAWRTYAQLGAATTTNYPYIGTYQGGSGCKDSLRRINLINLNLIKSDTYSIHDAYYAHRLPSNDIEAMKAAVADGPVAVYMYASLNFHRIGQGIYTTDPECQPQSNHALVVCGYDTDPVTGKEFWRVKNSWGTSWGDGGYAKVEMGKNVCGIESNVMVPILGVGKTDISNICVDGKECTSDNQCNSIEGGCYTGKCDCDTTCHEEKDCEGDIDCGRIIGACTKKGLLRDGRDWKTCDCVGKSYASNFTVALLEILFVLVVITTFINLSCYYRGRYGYMNDQKKCGEIDTV